MSGSVAIIDIDVRDQAFTKLREQFDQFQEAVKKQPSAWAALGKGADEVGKALTFAEGAMQGIEGHAGKTADVQKKFTKEAIAGRKVFEGLAADSKKLAGNVTSITKSMLSWAGIGGVFSGLLGVGGLFGLDRLARGVSSGSRSSQGLGVSYGEQKSFQLNYSRYTDPNGLLQKVADAKQDYSKLGWFRSLGIDGDVSTMNTQDLAMQVVRHGRDLYQHSDRSEQFVHARGIDQFLSMDDLRRLDKYSDADISGSEADTRRDNTALNLNGDTAAKWRNLGTSLDRAEKKIETVLVNGLTPLAGPLGQLSDQFAKAVKTFLDSGKLGGWMKELGDGLQGVAAYMGTKQFENDVRDFGSNVNKLMTSVGHAVVWFNDTFGGSDKPNGYKFPGVPYMEPAKPNSPDSDVPFWLDTPDHVVRRFGRWLGVHQEGIDEHGRSVGEPGYQAPGSSSSSGASERSSDAGSSPLPFPVSSAQFSRRAVVVARKLQQDFGITPAQSSGIVGNLGQESGLQAVNEANPTVPGTRGGFGWAQWTGPRRDAFEQWSRDHHLSPESFEANYGFLKYEMELPANKGTLDALRRAKTPSEAARAWFQFESGGDPRAIYGNREGIAEQVYRTLQPGAIVPGLPSLGTSAFGDQGMAPLGRRGQPVPPTIGRRRCAAPPPASKSRTRCATPRPRPPRSSPAPLRLLRPALARRSWWVMRGTACASSSTTTPGGRRSSRLGSSPRDRDLQL